MCAMCIQQQMLRDGALWTKQHIQWYLHLDIHQVRLWDCEISNLFSYEKRIYKRYVIQNVRLVWHLKMYCISSYWLACIFLYTWYIYQHLYIYIKDYVYTCTLYSEMGPHFTKRHQAKTIGLVFFYLMDLLMFIILMVKQTKWVLWHVNPTIKGQVFFYLFNKTKK